MVRSKGTIPYQQNENCCDPGDVACLIFWCGITLGEMTNESRRKNFIKSHAVELKILRQISGLGALTIACVLLCQIDARGDAIVTNLPSDTPKNFVPRTDAFDYVKREEMI